LEWWDLLLYWNYTKISALPWPLPSRRGIIKERVVLLLFKVPFVGGEFF